MSSFHRLTELPEIWRHFPAIIKSLLITTVWYSIWGLGPQILFRSTYLDPASDTTATLDPFSLHGHVVTASLYLLNGLPVFTVYMWFKGAAQSLETQLKKDSISDLKTPVVTRRKWDYIVSLAIVLPLLIPFSLGVANDQIVTWWESLGILSWIWVELSFVIFGWFLFLTLFSILHFWIWLHQELRRDLKIRPLSADGAGGLGMIGGIITRLTIFAIVMGISFGWLVLVNIYVLNAGLQEIATGMIVHAVMMFVLYVFLLSGLLLIPTMLVRKVMVRQRDARLQPLVDRFNLLMESRGNNQARVVEMQSVFAEYQLVRQNSPTLPFSVPNLRSLQALALIPPVIPLISILIRLGKDG